MYNFFPFNALGSVWKGSATFLVELIAHKAKQRGLPSPRCSVEGPRSQLQLKTGIRLDQESKLMARPFLTVSPVFWLTKQTGRQEPADLIVQATF